MYKPPCQNCEQRHRACHSSCETYQQYRKALDKYNEDRRKRKKEENDFYITHTRKTNFAYR